MEGKKSRLNFYSSPEVRQARILALEKATTLSRNVIDAKKIVEDAKVYEEYLLRD